MQKVTLKERISWWWADQTMFSLLTLFLIALMAGWGLLNLYFGIRYYHWLGVL